MKDDASMNGVTMPIDQRNADSGALLADQVYTLETAHGTTVGFAGRGADLKLTHGSAEIRPAYLMKLADRASAYLLVADQAFFKVMFPFDDRATSYDGPIIPLNAEVVETDVASFSFAHPSRKYLSAQIDSENVTVDRSVPGGWERFKMVPVAATNEPEAHECLQQLNSQAALAGVSENTEPVETIAALAAMNDPYAISLATALIHFAERKSLTSIVSRLSGFRSYPFVFLALQERLSDGQRRFEYQVRQRLANEISRYGWNVGDHSYGNPRIIEANLGKLTIGKYCSFNDFTIILGNHATDTVSSYPFADLSRFWPTCRSVDNLDDHVAKDVTIGNDVWIGAGALVLPGTTIGDGAVIGAHAVARGVIPPYAVVVGNPGKIVRYRFDETQRAELCEIAWWTWPDHKVDRFIPLILNNDIDKFIAINRVGLPRTVTDKSPESVLTVAADAEPVGLMKRIWRKTVT